MKIEFIARVWAIGGANILTIPQKIVNLFSIKKEEYYKVTLEKVKRK